jgi:hypothetical protein
MSEYSVLVTGMNDILIFPSPLVGKRKGEIGDNSHPLVKFSPIKGGGECFGCHTLWVWRFTFSF